MGESRFWQIDSLAARRLLARLKTEETPSVVEEVAMEFAEHRREVAQWVAESVQSKIIGVLEEHSMQDFGRMDENWNNGFRAAEELVARLTPDELMDQPSGKAPSKGQVLRSMVRVARKRSALVEKRSP